MQHTESGKIYVRKDLTLYDRSVFQYLQDQAPRGIPRIQELVEADGTLVVIEEYVSGRTLAECLKEDGPFSPRRAADCLCQLCEILGPLHHRTPPIVHRDLKPSNLILTGEDRVVLVDFNVAKESREDRKKDTHLLGTAGYAAPEQYGFSASTPAADLYALGVLLQTMLTGKEPGEAGDTGPFAPVIARCTQMDPRNRYPSVEALARAVRRVLGDPPSRRKPSWLPPGFRGKEPALWVVAGLGYALAVFLSLTLQVEHAWGAFLWANRLCCLALLLLETLWLGNYRGIWRKLPLTRSPVLWVRLAGALLWGFVLMVALFAVLVGVEPLLR
ncbi:MAG: serine/threonine-protein kinase [Evtepia sp.]|uniref:serine/threonine protein kinase n=1 Tax=Evtepia sp. TaxID=2773933 RepID=UPI002A7668A9|nr:serine/threonine-protein kinase [Evtepia sp.]MDY3014271.1 serine/threonine-protein kinase [Evtepia sp.]